MLVLVVALFALCWLPLQSYKLLQSFFPSINEMVSRTEPEFYHSDQRTTEVVIPPENQLTCEQVTLKVPSRNSCHCMCSQSRDNGFNFMKTDEIDGHGNSRRYLNLRMSSMDIGKRRLAKKLSNRDDLPIGDERVSELYIFPNSNIVEFTDISYDDKV